MPKKQPKQTLTFDHPSHYIFSCMANRFHLESEIGFKFATFGFVGRSGKLLDATRVALPDATLRGLRENLVQFSGKIGLPKSEPPPWTPPPLSSERLDYSNAFTSVPVVDFIHVSYLADELSAEICFWNYSHGKVADLMNTASGQTIPTWGVAMVRCDLDLQRAFLAALYKE